MQIMCDKCQNQLTVHQPDLVIANRLLGTCDVCHTWFTIDVGEAEEILAVEEIRNRGSLDMA